MSGWSGASILVYPERYDWFYLYSLIGSDQCSQLMRLGLQDCPRKAAHSGSSLSFLTLLLIFMHFVHFSFAACDTLDLVGKNESVGEGENYFAEIAYCLPLNWESAMSNGRTSLSREVNLSLQLDDSLKDYIVSSHNTICETSPDNHKRVENRRHKFIFMVCLYMCHFSLHKCKCKTQTLWIVNMTLQVL